MRRQSGYSLLELLLVLSLSGLLMTSVLAILRWTLPRWRVDQAARDVASSIRAARAKAILDQTVVSIAFDTDRNLYTLVAETAPGNVIHETGSDGLPLRLAELPDGVGFCRPDDGPSVTLEPPGAANDKAAVFDAGGLLLSTTKPGDVYLGVMDRDLYRRVRVNLIAGVELQRWTGSGWE